MLHRIARHDALAPDAAPFPGARPSAVLVTLIDGPLGAEVLLTRRSMLLTNHKGEISFPGGRVDEGETYEDTALREAHEEVGLRPEAVDIVGRLDPLATVVSMSYIVPVVACLSALPGLLPCSPEVDRVLWVPLAELTRHDTYREERWGTPPLDRPVHFFELDDETVWGATAHILRQLLAIVL
jgi:8-oxo-dGTP pyrophosphatase MutT (NUDIX family)